MIRRGDDGVLLSGISELTILTQGFKHGAERQAGQKGWVCFGPVGALPTVAPLQLQLQLQLQLLASSPSGQPPDQAERRTCRGIR
jgi:hypothetical protein